MHSNLKRNAAELLINTAKPLPNNVHSMLQAAEPCRSNSQNGQALDGSVGKQGVVLQWEQGRFSSKAGTFAQQR